MSAPPATEAPRLEGWSLARRRPRGEPYLAPEQLPFVLTGAVYGHPRHPDGRVVDTSYLVAVDGRTAHTSSGTAYRLGTPAAAYAAWHERVHGPLDPAAPVPPGVATPRPGAPTLPPAPDGG
jgi:hypothetical protein